MVYICLTQLNIFFKEQWELVERHEFAEEKFILPYHLELNMQ